MTTTADTCVWCDEHVEPDQRADQHQAWHSDCLLRALTGGLNHLRGRCSCYHGDLPSDPPEMTRRQAAKAAADYWRLGNHHLGRA